METVVNFVADYWWALAVLSMIFLVWTVTRLIFGMKKWGREEGITPPPYDLFLELCIYIFLSIGFGGTAVFGAIFAIVRHYEQMP